MKSLYYGTVVNVWGVWGLGVPLTNNDFKQTNEKFNKGKKFDEN